MWVEEGRALEEEFQDNPKQIEKHLFVPQNQHGEMISVHQAVTIFIFKARNRCRAFILDQNFKNPP